VQYGTRLFDQHAALLAASGISSEVASERGYVSVDTKTRLERVGFSKLQRRVPGLLIPVHDVTGEVATYEYRPDTPRVTDAGKTIKYEKPYGSANHLDVHPCIGKQLADPSAPLWITEGARKVDAAVTAGLCCVGIPGVYGWRGSDKDTGGKVALADWESVALKTRVVVLAFDCDVETNRNVRRALERLARFLGSRGATVRYALLPDIGDHKTGLDDYLGAGRTVNEIEIVDTLPAFTEPPAAGSTKPDAPARRPEDGDVVLHDCAQFVTRFCVFPSEHYTTAVVLWIAHTHCIDAFEITPRLVFLSETKQTGKSRALEVIDLIAARARYLASMTTAYLFRLADQSKPTLLFDEIDTVFGPKSRGNEELRGLINVGFRRSATVGRCVGDGSKQTPTEFAAFAPLAMAGIGDCVPDTVIDRSVVLRMRRRARDERIDSLRYGKVAAEARELRERLAAWGAAHVEALTHGDPIMPEGIEDRPADTWEALLAVADAAGGEWPDRARRACVVLNDARSLEDSSIAIRLLVDIRNVLHGDDAHVFSAELCSRLNDIEDAPWGGWHDGKGIAQRDLARRLKGFGIESKQVRVGDTTRKGYDVADFADTFTRYLPTSGTRETSETPLISTVSHVSAVSDVRKGGAVVYDEPDPDRPEYPPTFEEREHFAADHTADLHPDCEVCDSPGWRFSGRTLCATHRDELAFDEVGP
jgi:hypothetical protein